MVIACGDKTSVSTQSSNIANVEENSADRSGLFSCHSGPLAVCSEDGNPDCSVGFMVDIGC